MEIMTYIIILLCIGIWYFCGLEAYEIWKYKKIKFLKTQHKDYYNFFIIKKEVRPYKKFFILSGIIGLIYVFFNIIMVKKLKG